MWVRTWADIITKQKNSHHATTMNIPPPPPNMWQQAATQPFLIQTPLGPAYYNPSDGSLRSAFIPGAVIFPQSAQQQQQQIPAAASIAPAPPAHAASPMPPPPPPTSSAINQSTFYPSPAIVETLASSHMILLFFGRQLHRTLCCTSIVYCRSLKLPPREHFSSPFTTISLLSS